MGFGLEGGALEEASGAGGEAAGETDGVVAILHEPVWGDVAFGSVEEAYDGIKKPIRGPGRGDRGQTGLPAHFRQTAPEIHGSLVSPRGVFEGGAVTFPHSWGRARAFSTTTEMASRTFS